MTGQVVLSAQDRADIVAFLHALTDESFMDGHRVRSPTLSLQHVLPARRWTCSCPAVQGTRTMRTLRACAPAPSSRSR
jgi:hypothetical protein